MGLLTAFVLVLVACSRTTDTSIDLAPTRDIGTDPTDYPGKGPDPMVVAAEYRLSRTTDGCLRLETRIAAFDRGSTSTVFR